MLLPERTWARSPGISSAKRSIRSRALLALPGTAESLSARPRSPAMLRSVSSVRNRNSSASPCSETRAVAAARSRCSR